MKLRLRDGDALEDGDILTAGMRLEPTGRNPRHCTVGFDDPQGGVQRFVSRPHQAIPNAYYDA